VAINGTGPNGYVFEAYAGYCFVGNVTFNAGISMGQVFTAYFGGFLGLGQNAVYTFLGAANATGAWAIASSNGSIEVPVPYTPTYVNFGFATGQKYNATYNGVITVQGLGINYFPGNVAGALGSGGQYG